MIDYDKITREIYLKGSDCLNEIVCAFGEDILTNEGELERRKLGAIVFASKEKLDILNKIVYKYILLLSSGFTYTFLIQAQEKY